MIIQTKYKLHKQFSNQSVDRCYLIYLLCCFLLLVPYLVLGSKNPEKACDPDKYYKPYATVYKKIRGKVIMTIDDSGFMDTSKLCDKFMCINGPVMIYENAVDSAMGSMVSSGNLDSGLLDIVKKRQVNLRQILKSPCVAGLGTVPPGFDCNATGSGSGATSNSSMATGIPSPPPIDTPDTTPMDNKDSTTDSNLPNNPTTDPNLPNNPTTDPNLPNNPTTDPNLPNNPTTDTNLPNNPTTDPNLPNNPTTDSNLPNNPTTDSNLPGNPTTDSNLPGNPTTDSNLPGNPTTDSNLPGNPTTDPDIFKSSTTDSGMSSNTNNLGSNVPSNSGSTTDTQVPINIQNACVFKGPRLEVFDHKCFKLNQLPKKTKMNSRSVNARIVTSNNPNARAGIGGPGSCSMENVLGQKIYGIKMLTTEEDYRTASLTQFENDDFGFMKKGCDNDKLPTDHSFAAIGNPDVFDFCYEKKSKTESVALRLYMPKVPTSPKVCLYEPGDNNNFDKFFQGQRASAFSWKNCPSKFTSSLKTKQNVTIYQYGHFATYHRPSASGRMHNVMSKSNMKWTTTMSPGAKIMAKSKKGVSLMSDAALTSNCTDLPKFDANKCGGQNKTEDTCEFLQAALDLNKEEDHPQMKIRREALDLITGIFQKICVKVDSQLPPIVSRLLLFYMDQVIKKGDPFPMMNNETWKFLNNDLQTCFMQAQPMQFTFDDDVGDDDNATDGLPQARSAHNAGDGDFDNLGMDFNDALNRLTRRYLDPTSEAGGSVAEGSNHQKLFQEQDDENLAQRKRDSGSSGRGGIGRAFREDESDSGVANIRLGNAQQGEEYLMRAIQEVEEDADEDEDGNMTLMPLNVAVIHTLTRGRSNLLNRKRRDVRTETGIKLFYYSEAAEIEYDFNVALDAHWKVFSTVLGYCNKFYQSRKAETFPRLYNSYFEDIFEPITDTWISSSDNDALEIVVSAFTDPVTQEWLNSCLEASYIVSDSITFRPPRPLIFMEGADAVTNYFEEVPPPDFFIPEKLRTAVSRKYLSEPNAVDSDSGTLSKGRMVEIPNDPGCRWSCPDGEADCHKVCGASEKKVKPQKSITTLHSPDGEKKVIQTEIYRSNSGLDSDEEYYTDTDSATNIKDIQTYADSEPRLSRKIQHRKKKRGRHSKFGKEFNNSDINAANQKISHEKDNIMNSIETIPYNIIENWNSSDHLWHTGTVRKYDPIKVNDTLLDPVVNEKEVKDNSTLEKPPSRKKDLKLKNETHSHKNDSKLEKNDPRKGHSKTDKEFLHKNHAKTDKKLLYKKHSKTDNKIPHKNQNLKKHSKLLKKYNFRRNNTKLGEKGHSPKTYLKVEENNYSFKKYSKLGKNHFNENDTNKLEEKIQTRKRDSKIGENIHSHKQYPKLEENIHSLKKYPKLEQYIQSLKKHSKAKEKNNHFQTKDSKMDGKINSSQKELKADKDGYSYHKDLKANKNGHSQDKYVKTEEIGHPPHKDMKIEENIHSQKTEFEVTENSHSYNKERKDSKNSKDNKWNFKHPKSVVNNKNNLRKSYKKFFNKHEHSTKSKAVAHKKKRKEGGRRKLKVKSKPPVLARRLPVYDDSSLEPLPTTETAAKLVGATTTTMASYFTTTTTAPPMTTTLAKNQRKLDIVSQLGRNNERIKYNRAKQARLSAYHRQLKMTSQQPALKFKPMLLQK